MRKNLILLSILIFMVACKAPKSNYVVINEVFQTERDEPANIDSPAIWHGQDGQHWCIATAKKADALYVSDATNGKRIKIFGTSGKAPGQLERPNGISVFNDYAFVVERDNHRVQVFKLPEFESVGMIGTNDLIKPYGLYIYQDNQQQNHLYVTDNYETESEEIPPAAELNHRIHHYSFSFVDDTIKADLISKFGDTSPEGSIKITESIFGDPLNNHLLLAEEDTTQNCVKVYDFEGNYSGVKFGSEIFKGQVEGIALFEKEDGSGYWIVTDQSHTNNLFHIFERKSFKHLGAFKGPKTTNTDGIWLSRQSFGNFSQGAFYAIHNDGNVSAFDWRQISEALNLK